MMRYLLTTTFVFFASVATAQDARLEPPKTPAEFWSAVQFELNVGQFEFAADYLKGFLATNPTEKDLLDIEGKSGMATFLRLRTVPTWSLNKQLDAEAKEASEEVIKRATIALQTLLSDPQRINKFIKNLRGSQEERVYAIRELQRAGSAAMPHIINVLRSDNDPTERSYILNALPLMPQDTIAPILAATDMKDGLLKQQLLEVISRRGDFVSLPARPETDPLPTLEYLVANPAEADAVRRTAMNLIMRLRPLPPSAQPNPVVALVAAAEKFYRRQAKFLNPDAVPVWTYQNDTLVMTPAKATQAEEYMGLRYARWALELSPAYLPAQVVFLSIAVDKAMERSGLDGSLKKSAPAVYDLLGTADPTTLITTLDQAIVDRRSTVALALIQVLNDRAETRAVLPTRQRPGALVRALDFADRRVQMAAAVALTNMPGTIRHQSPAKIVEILRRALAAESEVAVTVKPRILVGHFDPVKRHDLAEMLRESGFEAITVATGQEVLRRLNFANDIDGVLLDSEVPYLTLTDLLASVRSSIQYGGLPVRVLLDTPEVPSFLPDVRGTPYQPSSQLRMALRGDAIDVSRQEEARIRRMIGEYRGVQIVSGPVTPLALKRAFTTEMQVVDEPALPLEVRKVQAFQALNLLKMMATGELAGYDVRPAGRAIRQAMRVKELTPTAIVAVGALPGVDAQSDLASMVLNTQAETPLRMQAAEQLVRHVARFGMALRHEQIQALVDSLATSPPELRPRVADVIGAINTNAEVTGKRLLRYTPPQATLPKAVDPEAKPPSKPTPEEMKKDKEEEDKG